MIPTEVANIASLIDPDWPECDEADCKVIIEMAYRIYNAGYRKPVSHTKPAGGE
ncbi:MAG TPA: hypothetical protein VIM11_26820 [Tepidisphaeraceae bacterium]|jgi:hypothetical protein